MKTHQKSKNKSLRSEAVLVLQGGGSLGAYECGVYKKLFEHSIEFDILAGSSIGAINASIICSAQNAKKMLQQFWRTFGFRYQKIFILNYYHYLCQHSYLHSTHCNCRWIK